MNRRFLVWNLFAGASAFAQGSTDAHQVWKNSMLERWRNAEGYTLDVLETMPEGELGYAPFANEFSFAAHLTHLAYFNVYLLTAITRRTPPSQMTSLMKRWAEPRAVTKNSVRDYLRVTFEEVQNIVLRLTP